ncbi:sigma-E factor negative regulatory protein [Thauera phenolivorans]|nr:sigma-E factor negative regulatory protein [Thauera phenolivorans]
MKDRLSAFLDGDLDGQAGTPLLDRLRKDPALKKDWEAYHLIGDVLRGESAGSRDFVDRVMAKIDGEPVLFAPGVASAAAAGRSRGGWQALMAVAASVMGVAAVGIVAASLYSGEPRVAQMAEMKRSAPATPVLAQAQPRDRLPMRNVAADRNIEYVFAHQGLSGSGAMPGAVQYVRAVSSVVQDPAR